MDYAIKIDPKDNVCVALSAVAAGTKLFENAALVAAEDIPMGHKIALRDIACGETVVKYAHTIGRATAPIRAGGHVHSENMETALSGVLEYTYEPSHAWEHTPDGNEQTFMGFARPDGSAGVRNEIWVLPTVGCVNGAAEAIAARAQAYVSGALDGVYAFTHPYGCSQLGEDHARTQDALIGLARHPNTFAVLILGLGCENNNIAVFKERLGAYDENRIFFLNSQDCEDEVEAGEEILRTLCARAAREQRVPCPLSKLTIGLKCGGSDGLSGVTANPLVGRFSDMMVAAGASVILTEVPEMFGAETILMQRCVNREVFDKTVDLVNGFKEYFIRHGQEVYENPSPGNRAGGITTLEDKSLGCIRKGGSSAVVDVLRYGQARSKAGLNLLEAPGNDLVASTALAVSGVQIVLFTTGRGTPFGAPVPTVKISSNTQLSRKKPRWIDFDAGALTSGADFEGLAQKLYAYVLDLAQGDARTWTERENIRDIAIFKTGVTL